MSQQEQYPTQRPSREAQRNAAREATVPELERYELLGPIARGGMATVYRAMDRNTREECAVKCVTVDQHQDARLYVEGLQREYQVLKGLRHPRIIRVHDYGLWNEGAYYAMELLSGNDLRSGGPFHWRQTCQYLHDIATCLSLLHARRLLHRDLSPANVKLTDDGHCKVIDFGALTSFGRANRVIGTPPFIAPEVIEVGRLDQRVDLYALGALGYFCLTGNHAYPAARVDALKRAWKTPPIAPHVLLPEVPQRLSELIMDLLRHDALARPASASEVITKLEHFTDLDADDTTAQRTLAQSFFAAPTFVGRRNELQQLQRDLERASNGAGSALRVVAPCGSGRTRLLDEVAVRAQLAGATVLRADASVHQSRYGTARALCSSLLDELPKFSRQSARPYHQLIANLFEIPLEDAAKWLTATDDTGPVVISTRPFDAWREHGGDYERSQPRVSLRPDLLHRNKNIEDWFIDVSRERVLAVLVDNVECADDGSVALLLGLARAAVRQRVLLLCTQTQSNAAARGTNEKHAFGLEALQQATSELSLPPLTPRDTEELMRSMFGESPRVERLAGWLHTESAGSPLHCLGLVRDLTARDEIRHERGTWVLPNSRPDTHVSQDLEDSLLRRVAALTPQSRELLGALCLNRLDTTHKLCAALVANQGAPDLDALLDELASHDILYSHHGKFVFSSAALRAALLRRMDASVRRKAHAQLGAAIEKLAAKEDRALHFEAGFHLIHGGDEIHGAQMVAEATKDIVACSMHIANLHHIGSTVEAALKVFRRTRRSRQQRLPLLSILAMSGYYEHYHWADHYGDEALDVVDEFSGLRTARKLRPVLGGPVAFALGVGLAALRHYMTPRRERVGSFVDLMLHLCGVVTALCAVAAISLDANRCSRVADVLSPASWLPRRMGLVGVYELCRGLQYIAQEFPARAFAVFDELATRFGKRGYYFLLPEPGREIYVPACHFARGAFALMRADGAAALESADQMDRCGLPLYAMIASQIRKLYYMNRGELSMAQVHRERVEVHAARVGSAWQVELWEPASLLPYYVATDDPVELSRIAHRVGAYAKDVPSMWRYRELSQLATKQHAMDEEAFRSLMLELDNMPPREFIGWSTTLASCAQFLNQSGMPELARKACDKVLAAMDDVDREYVMLFLQVEIQSALADATLGEPNAALGRLEALIARHSASQHALALGMLHEARARIALAHGRSSEYSDSLAEATRLLRGTGTPALVAIADRLATLGAGNDVASPVANAPELITLQFPSGRTRGQEKSPARSRERSETTGTLDTTRTEAPAISTAK